MSYLGFGEQTVENLIAQIVRLAIEAGKVAKDIEPLVIVGLQFFQTLVKLRDFDVFESQLVVEHAMSLLVKQANIVVYSVRRERGVAHFVVEQSYHIDVFELVVPYIALHGLLADWEGSIVERTVFKKSLIGILHLDDKLLTLLVLAIDIENGLAVGTDIPDMLAVEERHVLYDLLAIKEGVEKVDEQVLVGNSAEDALETEIGQQTDISFF